MQQLTNAEEQLMEHLWKLEKAFMKDLLEHFQNQKDHYRGHFTESMIDKDFVAYTEFGNLENTIH
jgi:predicted transcriptional regulator